MKKYYIEFAEVVIVVVAKLLLEEQARILLEQIRYTAEKIL